MSSWLDILPAIPLARGVPVRTRCGGQHAFTALVAADYGKDGGGVELVSMYPHRTQRRYRWRVDLNDPQGFGYALSHFMQGRNVLKGAPYSYYRAVMERLMEGKTTDADRIALAQALAEVVS